MSDEILELRKENNALKEMNGKLEAKIAELSKEIEAIKSERSYQQSSAESTIDNQSVSQLMKRTYEGESSEITPYVKRLKLIKERCVPNWLIEVLAWINRIEMANSKLSTSSELFKQLCWPKLYLNVKPHKIQRLEFFHVHYELGNLRAFVRRKNYNEQFGLFDDIIPISSIIPIASIQPPEYIIDIREINIKFMDEQVLNFVKSISLMLQNIILDFKMQLISSKMDKKQIALMRSLFEYLADKIYQLKLHVSNLNLFNRIFPGILDKIQVLYLWDLENSPIDDILNWLTNPMNNRKQKILQSTCPKYEFTTELIDRIKEEFSNSNSPSIFFIYFLCTNINLNQNFEEFILENERTNEILNLYSKNGHCGYVQLYHFYLARYPKGEKYWKKDGQNKTHQPIWKFPRININV